MSHAPVWLLTDAAADAHAAPGHPERPARRAAVAAGVRDAAGARLVEVACEPAGDDELAAIHDPAYLAMLAEADRRGGAWLDPDTYVTPGSWAAAVRAAGATRQAAVGVAEGGAVVAFAAVRPPGHHAARERGAGFCLLNNVAVAVAALRARGLARRVAIIDWDVHHGDGTQRIFDADPELCYASTHQSPLYPGTGAPHDRGSGAAIGTKHNRPLPPGAGDPEFVAAWTTELLPSVEAFAPEAILVSAGYDAHAADPLAQLAVTEAGYRVVAGALGALAGRLGLPGVALSLEGGYDLDAIRRSAAATVTGLLDGHARRR